MKKIYIILLLSLIVFKSNAQLKKGDLLLSTGLTVTNLTTSPFPSKTFKLQPIQVLKLVTDKIGVGLSMGYFYDKIGIVTTKEFSTNINLRTFIKSNSVIKPYGQISGGLGRINSSYNLKDYQIDPLDPMFSQNHESKGHSFNFSPTLGTLIFISKRFGADLNYQYSINNLNFTKSNMGSTKSKLKESRINLSLFFSFKKK
ncbi:hypothetical protein Emtol_0210 (plasmid) [Emticicia oligotrophica DSM 17448]|uniref:Outer membrane protein beta-barrel domain-containing protein n=1 Tax=Emticicia oligotrophica (strain DSM 17448 / CIP 109782 / MTCC 6937 / GPTSA100-15) TaxID=929562 RepID=A0ABN4AS38_EMTOG|nr:hypothetical protein [Emticicia oligotrophica]AFK05482.1 hypothetical protein Emtol_0210 [Emticicia oligotrophica DSM 17448]